MTSSDSALILIDYLDVVDGDADRPVAEARAAYDPDGDLPAAAAEAAPIAAEEGPVFGDEEGDGAGAGGPRAGAEGAIGVTDEQIACLDDAGIEDGEAIPDDVWEQCVGA